MVLPQSYDSLVVENAQWQLIWDYDETPWEDEMSGWLLRGDTLVNGLQYKKLYQRIFEEPYSEIITSESLFGFLREDVENRKVYAYDIIPGWLGCDILNQEYLLFDFSLAVGDTTQMCMLTEQIGGPVVLTEIQNYFVYGKERKAFSYGGYAVDFIEGIGHAQGLMESPVINVSSMDTWYLSDYCRGTNEECGVVYVKVEENSLKNSFSIYPNPAGDYTRLHFPDNELHFIKNIKLTINDVFGRIVKEISGLEYDYTIDVSDFQNGIYFVGLYDNKEVIASQKLNISRY